MNLLGPCHRLRTGSASRITASTAPGRLGARIAASPLRTQCACDAGEESGRRRTCADRCRPRCAAHARARRSPGGLDDRHARFGSASPASRTTAAAGWSRRCIALEDFARALPRLREKRPQIVQSRRRGRRGDLRALPRSAAGSTKLSDGYREHGRHADSRLSDCGARRPARTRSCCCGDRRAASRRSPREAAATRSSRSSF